MNIGGGAAKFLEFIETELIPFVNKGYRTHDFKVIAGASAAGTLRCTHCKQNLSCFRRILLIVRRCGGTLVQRQKAPKNLSPKPNN